MPIFEVALLFVVLEPEPKVRPTLEDTRKAFGVSGLGPNFFSLSGGFASYSVRWSRIIVMDVDWVFDKKRVMRVTRLAFRLMSKEDTFIPLGKRKSEKDDNRPEKNKKKGEKGTGYVSIDTRRLAQT
jgi:hypothetical protein